MGVTEGEGEGIYRKEGGCYRGGGEGYIGKRVGEREVEVEGIYRKEGGCYRGGRRGRGYIGPKRVGVTEGGGGDI